MHKQVPAIDLQRAVPERATFHKFVNDLITVSVQFFIGARHHGVFGGQPTNSRVRPARANKPPEAKKSEVVLTPAAAFSAIVRGVKAIP